MKCLVYRNKKLFPSLRRTFVLLQIPKICNLILYIAPEFTSSLFSMCHEKGRLRYTRYTAPLRNLADKIKTCVLLGPDGQPFSFEKDAVHYYENDVPDEEREDWRLFDDFDLILDETVCKL